MIPVFPPSVYRQAAEAAVSSKRMMIFSVVFFCAMLGFYGWLAWQIVYGTHSLEHREDGTWLCHTPHGNHGQSCLRIYPMFD